MYPFTQYFMLAPQLPKNYTVQNNFFCYQDELFPNFQQHSATQENTQDLQQKATAEEPKKTAVLHQQPETTFCDSPQEHPRTNNGTGAHLINEKVDSPDDMSAESWTALVSETLKQKGDASIPTE